MSRDQGAAQAALEEISSELDRASEVWLAKARASGRPEDLPACRRGCAFCCHQLVPLSAVEAQRIADYLGRLPRTQRQGISTAIDRQSQRFAAWVAQRRPTDIQDRATNQDYLRQRIPCPFLGPRNECQVYPARPLICRGHHALESSASCETGAAPIRTVPALDQATMAAVTEARQLTTLLNLPTSGGLISTFAPLFRAALKRPK